MGTMASQITSVSIVYSTVYSGADQRKSQSSASLAFVWGIHRWPLNFPHKRPVTQKMFPFDDVIMTRPNTPVPLFLFFRKYQNTVYLLTFSSIFYHSYWKHRQVQCAYNVLINVLSVDEALLKYIHELKLWEQRSRTLHEHITSYHMNIIMEQIENKCWTLSLRRFVSWINHLPPACWSTFWKSNFKQQLGCRFDIMDNISYFFVFWHMQLYTWSGRYFREEVIPWFFQFVHLFHALVLNCMKSISD